MIQSLTPKIYLLNIVKVKNTDFNHNKNNHNN